MVAFRGSKIYETAIFLAEILSPLVGHNRYALQNSAKMVKTLSDLTLEDTDVLVSFNVTALFTKVSVEKSLSVILHCSENDSTLAARTKLSPINIRDLLGMCLKTKYLIFDSKIYTQMEGAAMGSPVSPIVANLYMEWFEKTALQSFQYNIIEWKLCGRHVCWSV